jgi:hypothetical protein
MPPVICKVTVRKGPKKLRPNMCDVSVKRERDTLPIIKAFSPDAISDVLVQLGLTQAQAEAKAQSLNQDQSVTFELSIESNILAKLGL